MWAGDGMRGGGEGEYGVGDKKGRGEGDKKRGVGDEMGGGGIKTRTASASAPLLGLGGCWGGGGVKG